MKVIFFPGGMANTLVILCCLAVASAIAKPATNDQLDKVSAFVRFLLKKSSFATSLC